MVGQQTRNDLSVLFRKHPSTEDSKVWRPESNLPLLAPGDDVSLTVELPDGEILTEQSARAHTYRDYTPLCWISDEPPTPQLVIDLHEDHRNSGLLPVLLKDETETYGERCTVGVLAPEPLEHIDLWTPQDVIVRIWTALCQAEDDHPPAYGEESVEPFDENPPALAAEANLLADPDVLARQQLPRFIDEETRVALVPIRRGSDVLTVLGWSGASNHVSRTAGLSALLRSWEQRFGARVMRLGPDQLDVSVSAPPHELNHALAVAAEHWAFCPDRVLQNNGTVGTYAREIRGARTWSFWWD